MVKGELNRLLGKISRLHLQRSFTEFSKIGLSQGQPRILRYLKSHEGCIQREICDMCHMKPATVTEVLEKMADKNLVERRLDPDSRRNLQVFLTPLGRDYLLKAERVDQLLEEDIFRGFSPKDEEQALFYLERLYGNMVKAEEQSQQNQ